MPKYIRPPFSYSTGTHSFRLGIPMLETWYFFITEPLRSSEAKLRLLRNPLFDSFDQIISLGIWKVQLFIKREIQHLFKNIVFLFGEMQIAKNALTITIIRLDLALTGNVKSCCEVILCYQLLLNSAFISHVHENLSVGSRLLRAAGHVYSFPNTLQWRFRGHTSKRLPLAKLNSSQGTRKSQLYPPIECHDQT